MIQSEIAGDHPMLSAEVRADLATPERLKIGAYQSYPPARQCQFVVDLDARPLLVLVEAAALGSRVYEFMTIRRPGDIFHYLYVTCVDAAGNLAAHVASCRKRNVRGSSAAPSAQIEMPFTEFDDFFHWSGDDTLPYEATWRSHREGAWWTDKAHALLDQVRTLQARLRQKADFLLQHEIGLIDSVRHRRDMLADIDRRAIPETIAGDDAKMPPALFDVFMALIKRDDVQSVSCEFKDYSLWRALVAEQVRRAQAATGGKGSHFVLIKQDFGELACAERTVVGDWVLYKSKAPYRPWSIKRMVY